MAHRQKLLGSRYRITRNRPGQNIKVAIDCSAFAWVSVGALDAAETFSSQVQKLPEWRTGVERGYNAEAIFA
ncbi:hypothetical protein [Rhizobium mongolense]|uniref:hypothetical protein n=1 Tax=Rhizobium mongolense TaxID=57676 RepID=UPI000B877671|nr:hypothetical protein [Rhizobium mongolense]